MCLLDIMTFGVSASRYIRSVAYITDCPLLSTVTPDHVPWFTRGCTHVKQHSAPMELTEAALRLLDGQDWFDHLRDTVSELTWEGAGRTRNPALILPVTVRADIVHTLEYCRE